MAKPPRGRSLSGSSSSSGSSRSRSRSYTSSSLSLSRSTSSRSPSPIHPKKSFGDGLKRGRSPPPRYIISVKLGPLMGHPQIEGLSPNVFIGILKPDRNDSSIVELVYTWKSSPIPESLVLHIGQLTMNVNENHLREIFGNFGEVVHVRLAMDPTVNLPRGSDMLSSRHKVMPKSPIAHGWGTLYNGSH